MFYRMKYTEDVWNHLMQSPVDYELAYEGSRQLIVEIHDINKTWFLNYMNEVDSEIKEA